MENMIDLMKKKRFSIISLLLVLAVTAAAVSLTFITAEAANVALKNERLVAGSVANGANVIFDTIEFSAGNISYNNSTGVVTFNEPGRYIVNWWVVVNGGNGSNGYTFALTTSQGDIIEGCGIGSGQVCGFGIVDVVAAPVTLSLVNASSTTLYYAPGVPVNASMMIVEDDDV